jgi:hypothetical protein
MHCTHCTYYARRKVLQAKEKKMFKKMFEPEAKRKAAALAKQVGGRGRGREREREVETEREHFVVRSARKESSEKRTLLLHIHSLHTHTLTCLVLPQAKLDAVEAERATTKTRLQKRKVV